MGTVSVTVRAHGRKTSAEVLAKTSLAIRKAAHDIEAQAKVRAPVDTGNLKNSIQASGSDVEWRVDSPAEYSLYQEMGTRRMAAHPFMIPAVEIVRPVFLAALKSLTR